MGQEVTTTKNGLVRSWPEGEGWCSLIGDATLTRIHLTAKHLLTVLLILIGIVSTPVSCALADGPHSIFVDPVTQTKVIIHIHNASIATHQSQAGAADDSTLRASELPESVTLLIALAADLPSFAGELSAASQRISISEPVVPESPLAMPEFPPPRASS